MQLADFKQLVTDDTAISTVLGSILLVAITLVLAAVIGGFVTGFGDQLGQNAPSAQIEFDYDANTQDLEVFHDGGQAINSDNTRELRWANDDSFNPTPTPTEGMKFDSTNFNATNDNGGGSAPSVGEDGVPSGSVQAGDKIGESSENSFSNSDTIDLAWTGPGGGSSSIIASYEGPDAQA